VTSSLSFILQLRNFNFTSVTCKVGCICQLFGAWQQELKYTAVTSNLFCGSSLSVWIQVPEFELRIRLTLFKSYTCRAACRYWVGHPEVGDCAVVRLTNWLTLYLLMWRIWWAPNNASRGQMGFKLAFKGLKPQKPKSDVWCTFFVFTCRPGAICQFRVHGRGKR